MARSCVQRVDGHERHDDDRRERHDERRPARAVRGGGRERALLPNSRQCVSAAGSLLGHDRPHRRTAVRQQLGYERRRQSGQRQELQRPHPRDGAVGPGDEPRRDPRRVRAARGAGRGRRLHRRLPLVEVRPRPRRRRQGVRERAARRAEVGDCRRAGGGEPGGRVRDGRRSAHMAEHVRPQARARRDGRRRLSVDGTAIPGERGYVLRGLEPARAVQGFHGSRRRDVHGPHLHYEAIRLLSGGEELLPLPGQLQLRFLDHHHGRLPGGHRYGRELDHQFLSAHLRRTKCRHRLLASHHHQHLV